MSQLDYDEVPVTDLLEGDIVTHVWNASQKKWLQTSGSNEEHFKIPDIVWRVTREDDDYVYGDVIAPNGLVLDHDVAILNIRDLDCKVRVRVKADAEDDDRWNDNCTKCGARTYVGFNQVDHDGPCTV